MADLHISWEEYNKKTEQLASMVYKDGWDFNQVVCIAKGGMRAVSYTHLRAHEDGLLSRMPSSA